MLPDLLDICFLKNELEIWFYKIKMLKFFYLIPLRDPNNINIDARLPHT